jgi:hypothetical protein
VDQYLNNKQYEILDELLANPADAGTFHGYNLQQLVSSYPQSGILRALLAHAGTNDDIKHAAVYYNPQLLHKLINDPEALAPVSPAQIINLIDSKPSIGRFTPAENYFNSGTVTETQHAESAAATPDAQTSESKPEDTAPVVNSFSVAADELPPIPVPVVDNPPALPVEPVNEAAENTIQPVEAKVEIPVEDIEDEVYDEIVGIENISIPQPDVAEVSAETEVQPNEAKQQANDETEKLIIGNIASADYFMFDKSVADTRTESKAVEPEPAPEAPQAKEEAPAIKEEAPEVISKYNDEKMPYTFMWWLDKTRKEYAATYQPYNIETVTAKSTPEQPAVPRTADALQHQYYENIFHAQSLEELEKTPQPDGPEVKSKEDIIIEKFIKEEPQIRPPSPNKIDNENKAKKSSEDRNELVSETLAHIYTEQMLYHKAIATYKKLMLKFPDKSRYFASQIEQLEKKAN